MSKFSEIITKDVKELVKKLTGFEDIQDNFKTCERFVMSNLLHHRYMSVDGHAVRRSVDGIVLKFQIQGLHQRAEELDALFQKFLALDFKDHDTADIQWYLLSLLLHMAQSPTKDFSDIYNESQSTVSISGDEEENFDWVSYLKEGEEDYRQDWNDDTSEEDEVDCMVFMENTSESLLPSLALEESLPSLSISLKSQESSDILKAKQEVASKKNNLLNAQKIVTAERWMNSNLQHDWWSKAFYKEKPLSNNPFSQSSCLQDPAQTEGIMTSTFSEHKVVLEIIWLLSAPCDSAIFVRLISDDGLKTHFSVRPHVTAPSLTQEVFSSFVSSVCIHADKLEELHGFCSEILENNAPKSVCGTYEAYRCALLRELKLFYDSLSLLEQRAHKQEDTLTLLMLVEELSPWLDKVASLHSLHSLAVLDWRKTPNWQCATHLLSVILSSLRSSDGDIRKNFRLFVQSFRVYVNIIDQWLSGGQLNDPRDEFFITRRENKSCSREAKFEKRDWEAKVAAHGVESPKALQVLANCLLQAAEPLHILCELKRLPELRKYTATRSSLETLFFQNLVYDLETSQSQIADIVEDKKEGETEVWWKDLDCDLTSKVKSDTDPQPAKESVCNIKEVDVGAILSHLHRIEEPLLLKDFQSFFSVTNLTRTPHFNEKKQDSLLEKLLLLSNSVSEHLPLESCVERAVLRLSADWEGIAGALVAVILIREHQLLSHLHSAQSVFMLQVSHKLNPFLSNLFKMILHQKDSISSSSHSLSILLQDCVDSDNIHFSVGPGKGDSSEMNTLDFIDSFSLEYQVEWPISSILGGKNQSSYNLVSCLLLKLRWGLWILEKLNVRNDLISPNDVEVAKRLLHLRFWLLHVIRGSYSFLAGHILNALWIKFDEDVRSAKDMYSIIQVHDKFLDCILKKSLHAEKPDPVKNALFQLVVLAENLYYLWNGTPSDVMQRKLRNIETCYIECHLFLAAALHSLAEEEGLQDLVFLSDLFNCNLPEQRKDP